MNKKSVNIILAGVGGQGTILASEILSQVGLAAGYDVKKSEVHGMAQRGGGVESQVRWGEKVYSPLIEVGTADYLLGFELLETMRWLKQLSPMGKIIANKYKILPPTVNMETSTYPADEVITEAFKHHAKSVFWLEATQKAKVMGTPALAGVIMLGSLATELDVSKEVWIKAIEEMVPKSFIDLNVKSFQLGMDLANR